MKQKTLAIMSLVFLILLDSIVVAENIIPAYVRGRTASSSFDFTFNFTSDVTCNDVLKTVETTIATDANGIGFASLDISDLTTPPAYMCEYQDGVLIAAHIWNDLITRNITANLFGDGTDYYMISQLALDSNASTACSDGRYLDGSGLCINFNDTVKRLFAEQNIVLNATSIFTEVGTFTGGDLSSVQVLGDDETYNVTEVTGSPGFTININFTNVTNFNTVALRGKYTGGAGHTVELELLRVSTNTWEERAKITDQMDFGVTTFDVFIGSDFINTSVGNGTVQFRINHDDNGINTHKYELDAVFIGQVAGLVSGGDLEDLTGRDNACSLLPDVFCKDGSKVMTGNLNVSDNNVTGVECILPIDESGMLCWDDTFEWIIGNALYFLTSGANPAIASITGTISFSDDNTVTLGNSTADILKTDRLQKISVTENDYISLTKDGISNTDIEVYMNDKPILTFVEDTFPVTPGMVYGNFENDDYDWIFRTENNNATLFIDASTDTVGFNGSVEKNDNPINSTVELDKRYLQNDSSVNFSDVTILKDLVVTENGTMNRLTLGSATDNPGRVINAERDYTTVASNIFGMVFTPIVTPSTSSNKQVFGFAVYPNLKGAFGYEGVYGFFAQPKDRHTAGTLATLVGFAVQIFKDNIGTLNKGYGIQIQNPFHTAGTINTLYGIRILEQTKGTENWQILLDGGDSLMDCDDCEFWFGEGASERTDMFISWDGADGVINTTTGDLHILNNTGYGTIVYGNAVEMSTIFDKSEGSALDLIKDSDEYRNPDRSINKSSHYAYTQIRVKDGDNCTEELDLREYCYLNQLNDNVLCSETQEEPTPNGFTEIIRDYNRTVCGTKLVDGLDVGKRRATMEQAVYELGEENCNDRLTVLENCIINSENFIELQECIK
jgi:hypothetical protein